MIFQNRKHQTHPADFQRSHRFGYQKTNMKDNNNKTIHTNYINTKYKHINEKKK